AAPGEVAVEGLLGRLLRPRGVDLAAIEARALVGVRQQLVRRGQRLEPFGRGRVARVQVRVVLLRQLAESGADLVGGRGAADAERDVGIVHVANIGCPARAGTPSPGPARDSPKPRRPAPRPQLSSMRRSRSTSSAKPASAAISSPIRLTACITVVWSRLPNLRPIS